MIPRRAAALAGALLALTLIGAPRAGAADEADIAGFDRTEGGLQVSVNVPPGVDVDTDAVTATLDGEPVDVTAQRFSDGDSTAVRTTILAIDTSNSMEGGRIAAAKAAAESFLTSVPSDVRVGIVTFSSSAIAALPPTDDRAAARAVVRGLTLSQQTRLFDGVVKALDLAGASGQRSVLVLSDGRNTTGTNSKEDARAAVEDSGIAVSVVALEQQPADRAILEDIAGSNGRVIASTREALASAFDAEAETLRRQITVTIDAPDEILAEQVSVGVSLPADTGVLTAEELYGGDSADAPPEPRVAAPPVLVDESLPSWVLYGAVALVFVGLLAALVVLVPAGRVVPRSPQARISSYTAGLVPGSTVAKQDEPALTQATDVIDGVLRRNRGLDERITARLLGAGSALKASEWLLLHAGIAIGALLLGLLLGRGAVGLGLVFLVLGAVLPWVYLGLRRSRRRRKFESALPETLQLMSGSLSAGLSMLQAVDTIVREGADPVASEFRRVLVEIRLGVALDVALEGVAERFDSRDFRWVVMAIRIQRQVGGNLAELLTTVSATIREREYIRHQVSALAAEGKLSAIVLGALPPAFLLYLVAAQPSYVSVLFTDIRGLIMLVGGAVWLGIGIFWMSRLIRVEV